MRAPFVTLCGLGLLALWADAADPPDFYHNYDLDQSASGKVGIVGIVKLLQKMSDSQTSKLRKMTTLYSKTSQRCKADVSAETATGANLGAEIESLTNAKSLVDEESAKLSKEVEADNLRHSDLIRDIEVIKTVRQNEKIEYKQNKDATNGAIKALNTAIKQLMDTANLLQVQHKVHPVLKQIAERFPEHAPSIHAFLQTEAAPSNTPKNDKRKGGDVVDLLETLQVKLLEQFHKKELEEYSAQNLYEEMHEELAREATNYFLFANDKNAEVKSYEDESGMYATEISRNEKLKATSDSSLTTMTRICSASDKHFAKMNALISSEIVALKEAVGILWAWVQKHTPANAGPNFEFTYKPSMLAQLRSEQRVDSVMRSKLVAYLQSQSQQLNSKVLAAVAKKAQIQNFGDIMKMIKDLMILLIKEATNAQTDFNWCSRYIHENHDQRKRQVSEIENLHGEISELQKSITDFKAELGTAEDNLKKSKGTLESEQTDYETTLDQNQKDLADRKVADKSLSQALLVLMDYYNDKRPALEKDTSMMFAAGTGGYTAQDHTDNKQWSIAQENGDFSSNAAGYTPILNDEQHITAAGSTNGGNMAYYLHGDDLNHDPGNNDDHNNVVDKVTMIRNRCLQEIQELRSDNEQAKKAWAKRKGDLSQEIGQFDAEVKHVTALVAKYEADETAKIQDLKSAKLVLKEALDLLVNTLTPTCMDGSTVASTRGAERAKEIKALKDALRVLNSYREG